MVKVQDDKLIKLIIEGLECQIFLHLKFNIPESRARSKDE